MFNPKNQTNRVLENNIAPGIKIYGITGTTQYIVVTPGSEYSFTTEADARSFAQELAQKREIYKTATLDHQGVKPASEGIPPVVGTPKKRRFRIDF